MNDVCKCFCLGRETKVCQNRRDDNLYLVDIVAWNIIPNWEDILCKALTSPFFGPWQDKGRPLPKFGEWDVNDPASAEGFTVIFNKARDEKKTGGKPESPAKNQPTSKPGIESTKSQPVSCFSGLCVCELFLETAFSYLP